METTPALVDDVVLAFCDSVNPKTAPVYVPVKADAAAERLDCYGNVRQRVEAQGGAAEFGWIIWIDPGRIIETEHHAIWVSPAGERIDISPHTEDRVLFLPGAEPYRGKRIPNIRQSLSADPGMRQFIAIRERIDRLIDRHTLPDGNIELTEEIIGLERESLVLQQQMGWVPTQAQFDAEMPVGRVEWSPRAASAARPMSGNAPCPCGSGKKYKKCCRPAQ